MRSLTIIFLMILLGSATFMARAQVPRFISYQGLYTDTLGVPKPDGDYRFTFRFYADSVGGNALLPPDQRVLRVKRGLFSVLLGGQPGFESIFSGPRWLSLQIENDPEISRRIQLAATAYSFHSIRSDTALVALNAPLQQVADSARIAGTVANNSITSLKILDGTIQTIDVAANFKSPKADSADYVRSLPPIDSARVAGTVPDNAITTQKLADGAVSSTKILDGTIQTVDVAANFKAPDAAIADTVRRAPPTVVAPGSIDSSKLATNAVVSSRIANGAVTAAKIAAGQVVKGLNDVKDMIRLVGRSNATVNTSNDTIYIDAVGGGTGIQGVQNTNNTLTITNPGGPVATINVRDQGIGTTQLGDGAVTQTKLAPGVTLPPSGTAGGDLTGTFPNPAIATNAVTTAKIADGNVSTAKIADAAVTQAKLAAGVTLPPGGAAGGDLTGTYPNPTIAPNAVTTAKIADGNVSTAKIADAAVTQAKLAAGVTLPPGGAAGGDLTGTFPNPAIATNAVTTAKIADGNVSTAKIADAAVTQAKLAAGVTLPPGGAAGGDLTGTYPNPTIAPNSVTTPKIADGSVTQAKIASGVSLPPSGTAGGDLTGTFPAPTIAPNAVTTGKIADGTILFQDIGQNGAAAGQVMKWTGTAWAPRADSLGSGGGVSGSGVAGQLSFWNGATSLSGNNNLFWDNTTSLLGTQNFRLPATNATQGIVFLGPDRFIHAFGSANTFLGVRAGNLTVFAGSASTAVGFEALTANTSGTVNTAVGYFALHSNMTGSDNVAIGVSALQLATSANFNTAVGSRALANTSGVAPASFSNTAVGYEALLLNTTGANNVAVGLHAGTTDVFTNANVSGNNNVFIGLRAGPGTPTQLTNAIAIGAYAHVNQSNSMVLGGTGANAVNVGIGVDSTTNILTIQQGSTTDPIADAWTTYSSRRWKTNIHTLDSALEKVEKLRGVSYDWKANGKHDIGLIAEEVGQIIPEVVQYEENGVDARSVDYPRLVAVLIEAVKGQQKQIEQLQTAVTSLQEKTSLKSSLGELK